MSSSSAVAPPWLDYLRTRAAPKTRPALNATTVLALLVVTAVAVLVHGYHLGADDAAIYVPAIKNVADPSLYPFGSEFFMSHAHLSLFSDIVGDSASLTACRSTSSSSRGTPEASSCCYWHRGGWPVCASKRTPRVGAQCSCWPLY